MLLNFRTFVLESMCNNNSCSVFIEHHSMLCDAIKQYNLRDLVWITDDENEVLYLMRKSPKKGWEILPVEIEQPKHDLTQFQLEQPVNRSVNAVRSSLISFNL